MKMVTDSIKEEPDRATRIVYIGDVHDHLVKQIMGIVDWSVYTVLLPLQQHIVFGPR